MKVLTWSSFFLPDVGGIETLLGSLLPLIRTRDVDLSVITSHGAVRAPDVSDLDGIPVYRFPFRRVIEQQNPVETLQLIRRVGELKTALAPDVVHVHFSDSAVFFHLESRRFRHVPDVITFHQDYRFYGIKSAARSLLKKAVDGASWVTAVSGKTREGALEFTDGRTDRLSVVYNGVSGAADLDVAPADLSAPRLLSLGRLVEQKRIDKTIDAFGMIADQYEASRLWIAGDGPLQSELEEQVNRLGLKSRVDFLGRVDPARVSSLLRQASMLVLSSDVEGLPMVALEAGACARAVVAFDVGGISEAVVHGETGLLISSGTSADLAAAMAELLADPRRCASMGLAARRRIMAGFSLESAADQYVSIYSNVLGEASPDG